jgi:hypothetical protein
VTEEPKISLKERLLAETALIAWRELQRFFAQGVVLHAHDSLDLVEVAVCLADNNVKQVAAWRKMSLLVPPSNQTARDWYDNNVDLWTVVVAPFVIVQFPAT